jgi:hypothetical protein
MFQGFAPSSKPSLKMEDASPPLLRVGKYNVVDLGLNTEKVCSKLQGLLLNSNHGYWRSVSPLVRVQYYLPGPVLPEATDPKYSLKLPRFHKTLCSLSSLLPHGKTEAVDISIPICQSVLIFVVHVIYME